MKEHSASDPYPFTDAEYTIGVVLTLFHELYSVFYQKPSPTEVDNVNVWLRNVLENLEIYIVTGSRTLESNMEAGMNASARLGERLTIPLWSYFHSMYTYLELCKYLNPLLDYMLAESRKYKYIDAIWLGSRLATIREEGKRLAANVRLCAKNLQDKLQGPAVLQEITREILRDRSKTTSEDVIGTELQSLGDESNLICQDIQESWIEALDGLIGTKIT